MGLMLILSKPPVVATAIQRLGSADLGNNTGAAGPWTVSYSVNAASNCLVVSVTGGYGPAVDDITGVTYAGFPMIKAGYAAGSASPVQRSQYAWYLFNPVTGTNSLVFTNNASGSDTYFMAVAADYSNVKTSGLDAGGMSYTQSASGSLAAAGNVNTAGAWVVSCFGGGTVNNATNDKLTQAVKGAAYNCPFIFDSNAAVASTGAYPNTFSFTATPCATIVFSLGAT
jgi:hypothetical protein